jgi:hypothetical protein
MWYSEFYNGLLDHKYVSLGIQYYLLARVGSRFPFNPASGNLYHLGFELLIKSYLKSKYSAKDLQNNFGHSLVKLWNEFKTETLVDGLEKYDSTFKNLDTWENVRYIELKGGKEAHAIEIVKGSAPEEYLEKISSSDSHSLESFKLYIDDMDELFSVFFSTLKVPPEELLKNPDFAWGRNLYEQDNRYNLLNHQK